MTDAQATLEETEAGKQGKFCLFCVS